MENKSRLPTMVKKQGPIKSHVPTDRLIPNTNVAGAKTTRTALASFENVMSRFQKEASERSEPHKPMKRHASPEFRSSRPPIFAKKMRRSRSVSDIQSVLNLVNVQKPTMRPFAMPRGQAPKSSSLRAPTAKADAAPKVPLVAKLKPIVTRPNVPAVTKPNAAVTKSKAISVPAHKILAVKPATTVTAKKVTTTSTAKAAPKRVPSYDFKTRYNDLLEKHRALKDKHERLKEQFGELETLPDMYDECKQKLESLEAEYTAVQQQLTSLEQQDREQKLQIETLNNDLKAKIAECRAEIDAKKILKEQLTVATKEIGDLKESNSAFEEKVNTQQETIEQLKQELQEAGEQLFRANIERKDLHNTIMDLRGNIRVFCRIRPPLEGEQNRMLCEWQHNDETSFEIASVQNQKAVKQPFSFDQVFRPNSLQQEVFELVSPLVQSALDGYNVCIFAYGQTGSGKTFTMDGTDSAPGIIPRTIDFLFECFKQNKRLGWDFTLRASALEIYNETLYDLLSNESKDLDIRMANAKSPTEIYVSNLTDVVVQNTNELHGLMNLAKRNRATAATAGNERSSRSHSVTQLRLIGEHAGKDEITVSTINLIDLAGSESPKTSNRMEETKKINKSLSELTNVIMALLQKQDHIPYRNSKLTHLLMPSLGGNSKTLMFVNASPFQDCYVETVKSLRFAASVNTCKMNKAKKNRIYSNTLSTSS